MNYFNENLDDIGFTLLDVCSELQDYIQSFWIVRTKNLPFSFPLKIQADGNSGIVINFDSPFKTKINDVEQICKDKFTYFPPSKYSGEVSFNGSLDAIGIRFNAAGVYMFFDKDISTLSSKSLVLDNEAWNLNSLYESLTKVSQTKEKVKILESFLLKKLQCSKKKNVPWIFDFIKKIKVEEGNINIESLCEEFKLNIRHVERRFKIELGLSPKVYCRIIRMLSTRKELSDISSDSLTSIAHEKGFYDQAHFIHEFKFFLKESPKSYFNKKIAMAKKYNFKEYKR